MTNTQNDGIVWNGFDDFIAPHTSESKAKDGLTLEECILSVLDPSDIFPLKKVNDKKKD